MSQPPATPPSAFAQLMATIEDRKANPPERSYTTSLFQGGVEKIGRKILEEANEVVEAAAESGADGHGHFVHEAADLIYHLFVMLAQCDVKLEEVEAELRQRFGISGLDEKAARPQKGNSP
ncbi:MAG: phosphoribosyl-ATP diphosphatase [Planctomycetota bacterium]